MKVALGLVSQSQSAVLLSPVIQYPVTPTLSLAVNVVIGIVKLFEVDGMVKSVTTGGVVSAEVIVTLADLEVLTLPAASLAQAYAVWLPADAKVNDVLGLASQSQSAVLFDPVTQYPATPTLSVATNAVIGTVRLVEVDGIVKVVTVGGVVSALPPPGDTRPS